MAIPKSGTFPAPGLPQNLIYFVRRGCFQLHKIFGHGDYTWTDGKYYSDDINFVSYGNLGGGLFEGYFYKSTDSNFFLFFGNRSTETSGTDGIAADLPVYDVFYSFDDLSYNSWPLSQLAIRSDLPNTVLGDPIPGSAGTTAGNATSAGKIEIHGATWRVSLDHNEVQALSEGGGTVAALLPIPLVRTAILTAITIVTTVDLLGGNKGVDISGVLGTSTIFVTPKGSFDIFRAVQIIGATAKVIADQTSAAAKVAFNQVKAAWDNVKDAGDVIADKLDVSKWHL